ncbi:MAG: hypothetical protein D6696_16045 [Acidobacteria bacterium]|nr:MAG: hypothetical protein D6696_16045 [Acidobacteriota bacterium]
MALTHIGPYRIERQLGVGGMGEVYRAYDERLGRRVAIKRLRAEITAKPNVKKRLRREARAVAQLSHPAIVQLYDILDAEVGECIVMEHVEGLTLAALIQDAPLEVERALRLGREIAEGLASAHDRGLVHRDLKAENVIVTPDGHAKILDFGIAKQLRLEDADETDLTEDDAFVGTFRAMSPEQAHQRPVDFRSDLFALGTLLYEMLTGENPFAASSPLATMVRISIHQQRPVIEINPAVPSDLSSLIDRLLAKDPALRPQNSREVATDLERILVMVSGAAQTAGVELLDRLVDELASAGFVAKAIALLKTMDTGGADPRVIEEKLVQRISQSRRKRNDLKGEPTEIAGSRPSRRLSSDLSTLTGIANVPLFSHFDADELSAIIHGLKVYTYEAGEILFTEGESGASLIVLASGVVRVYVKNASGGNTEIRRLEQGSFFGEISLLTGEPRSATITAATACEVLVLDRPTVEAIIERHPKVRDTLRDIYRQRAGSAEERRARANPTPPA